jgi:lipopolysaccharide export system protein LptC
MDDFSLKKSVPYLLAILVAGASWALVEYFRLPDDDMPSAPSVAKKNGPTYFSKRYLKKEMDENGGVKSQLAAEEMLHYSDEGETHMIKPVMTLYNKGAPPWIIQSEKGILSKNGQDLRLEGKVFIHRDKAEGVRELSIETTDLNVKLKESYAEGTDWATLRSPPHWTKGKGIQMKFSKPISLKLLANVKSYYDTK